MTTAETIDRYFSERNYYPHVPYQSFGTALVEEAKSASLGVPVACALSRAGIGREEHHGM